ncbi:hypothetical protein CERSUDRAFT_78072 [Gelatoporia subvermispora B]|uniref:Uncharacterized protein n=1 Tax=Ceriporiopsis subvermispora (strain B) TaxID=914234 RepID=M2QYL4_CERS8|nr:hypothetical protein CERSUDRAFT_78072 [Gelatoporia subvermispora B]
MPAATPACPIQRETGIDVALDRVNVLVMKADVGLTTSESREELGTQSVYTGVTGCGIAEVRPLSADAAVVGSSSTSEKRPKSNRKTQRAYGVGRTLVCLGGACSTSALPMTTARPTRPSVPLGGHEVTSVENWPAGTDVEAYALSADVAPRSQSHEIQIVCALASKDVAARIVQKAILVLDIRERSAQQAQQEAGLSCSTFCITALLKTRSSPSRQAFSCLRGLPACSMLAALSGNNSLKEM